MFLCVAVIDAVETEFVSVEDSSSALDALEAEEAAFLEQSYDTLAQRVATGAAGSVVISHNAQPVAQAIPAAAAAAAANGNIRWGIVIDAGLFLKFPYDALITSNSRGD